MSRDHGDLADCTTMGKYQIARGQICARHLICCFITYKYEFIVQKNAIPEVNSADYRHALRNVVFLGDRRTVGLRKGTLGAISKYLKLDCGPVRHRGAPAGYELLVPGGRIRRSGSTAPW